MRGTLWTLDLSRTFADLIKEEADKGNIWNNCLTRTGWDNLIRRFDEITGFKWEQSVFKHKIDVMKKDYKHYCELLAYTGPDGVRDDGRIMQTSAWWDARIAEKKSYGRIQRYGFPYLKQFDALYEGRRPVMVSGPRSPHAEAQSRPVDPSRTNPVIYTNTQDGVGFEEAATPKSYTGVDETRRRGTQGGFHPTSGLRSQGTSSSGWDSQMQWSGPEFSWSVHVEQGRRTSVGTEKLGGGTYPSPSLTVSVSFRGGEPSTGQRSYPQPSSQQAQTQAEEHPHCRSRAETESQSGMAFLGQNILRAAELFEQASRRWACGGDSSQYEEAFNALNDLGLGTTSSLYFFALSHLERPQHQRTFLHVPAEARLAYLQWRLNRWDGQFGSP